MIVALVAGPAYAQSQPAAPASTSASASEVVSTAPAKSLTPNTTDAQIADWIKGAPPLGLSDDDAGGVISTTPDRGLHGEAGAFVSNRGYGGYVAATMPVGKDAVLGVAVSDTHYNGRYFRGDARSLAAHLSLGQRAQRPIRCDGALQVGDHYVAPLWAGRFHGAALEDDPDTCFAPLGAR